MMLTGIPLNFTPLRQSCWEIYEQIYAYFAGLAQEDEFADLDDEESNSKDCEGQLLLDAQSVEITINSDETCNKAESVHNKEDLDSGRLKMTFTTRAILTAILLGTALVTAKSLRDLTIVIDVLGNTLGVFIMIAGPGFMMRNVLSKVGF